MSRFVALVKVSFLALLQSFSFGGKKKKKISGIGALVFMGALCIYMSGAYSAMFALVLKPAGMLHLMPMLMAVMTVIMSMMLTVFAGSGIVFGGKDSDFVLALPISAFQVMLSKIMALYLDNLFITLFMMLPCGVIYVSMGAPGGILFLLRLLVACLFLALLPTLLGVVIGYVIAWFSSKVVKKSAITTVLYVLFFVGVMALSLQLNGMLNNLVANANAVEASLRSWLLPFGLFGQACAGDLLSLLLLVVITKGPFLLVVWLFSHRYKAILSGMSSRALAKNYKLSAVEYATPFKALYKKEFARYIGSPMYLLNTGFGMIMLIGASVFALVKKADLDFFLLQAGVELPLFELLVAGIAFMIGTVCTTSVSLSLEGKNLWILKGAPVPAKTVFDAKLALNLSLTIPTILICSTLLGVAFGLSVVQVVCAILACCAFSGFVSAFGLTVNLRWPKLDADNDTIVVKQSLSSMIGIFGGMLVVVAAGLLYAALRNVVPFELYLVLMVALFVLLGTLCMRWLSRKGTQMFLEL